MLLLREQEIIDGDAGAHYACIRSMRGITELHCHDFYEVFLIAQGRIYHLINGQRNLLGPGTLVLIRPQDQHCYERYGEEECQILNLAVPARTFEALVEYLGADGLPAGILTAPMPVTRLLNQGEQAAVAARLAGVGAIPVYRKREFRMAARAALADVLARCFAAPETVSKPPMPQWLSELVRQMQRPEHFTGGLPLLHELAPTTPEHLCRLIRRHLGQTPTQWINDLRLGYAASLLTQTDEAIVTIALQAGFENLSHFYHLFTRHYGLSPARYRKEQGRNVVPL